jgi:hypothetical protein
MNRRDFMKGILAAGMAPAIVKAENIMRINPRILTMDNNWGADFVPDRSVAVLYDPYKRIIGWAPINQNKTFHEMRMAMLDGTIKASDLEVSGFSFEAKQTGVATEMALIDGAGEKRFYRSKICLAVTTPATESRC